MQAKSIPQTTRKAIVDATGDADVAYRCGCPTHMGRDSDGGMSPGTLIFLVEDADSQAFEDYCTSANDVRLRRIITDLEARGDWPFPYRTLVMCELPNRGSFFVNGMLEFDLDGTDEASLTRGMIQGRLHAKTIMAFLKEHVPGFSETRMSQTAPTIGVRETRRIEGKYTLTVEDVRQGAIFEDTIALTGFGWDLGDPKKAHQPMFEKHLLLPYTEIPYRCLVPQRVENLIVAGRCVSVERDVLGPIRIQPTCYAMGEAAGIAAATVADTEKCFADIDTTQLREVLQNNGAIICSDRQCDQELLMSWIIQHSAETGQE